MKPKIMVVSFAVIFLAFFVYLGLRNNCCDTCICPGEGVGPVRLRMPEGAVTDIIGPAKNRIQIDTVFELAYPSKGVLISGDRENGVAVISLVDDAGAGLAEFHKEEVVAFPGKIDGRIGIGSSQAEVEDFFDGPVVDEGGVYNRAYSGITFFFDEEQNVKMIQVHQRSD